MNRWLLVFLLALTGLRLFLGGRMELSPDETYYYQWSQRLDWAYYSKGPGVALAIRAGTALLGPTEMGVRFLSPFLALGTSLWIFGLARRIYGESVAIWAVLLMNATPIFNAGAIVMTIDALSIFFWAAALWAIWLALERAPKFSGYWPLAGFFMGLGFLAKYTNALELFSVALVLGLTAQYRREFARPGFWVMLGVFALAVIPPVLWNANHDWITVEHLRSRGGLNSGPQFHPTELLGFIGLHFGVYSPLIFAGMLWALWRGCREGWSDFRCKFLALFALPLLVMYCVLSLKKCGEANWTAPAFVSLGILTVAFWHEWAQRSGKARKFAAAALGLGLVVSLLLVDTDSVRRLGIHWPYKYDPSGRLRGWETVAIAMNDLRHKMEQETGKPLFLIANKYQTASSLSFYLPEKRVDGPGHPPVYIPESQAIENQYSFWGRYDELTEPPEIARAMLPKVEDPAKREALTTALKDFDAPIPSKQDQEKLAERRRGLIRAMLAIDPTLPMEEYSSEDWGISLFQGRDALFVTDRSERAPSAIQKGFEKVELVATLQEERRGMPLRLIWVFACHNYHSLPL
ncbi:MAG: glycosyltransferase family 39 protein [Verrucomicrobia bacterium]|nr:glycosyltransferase family 39 protein [Verrucomicrobiota bacterium]